MKYNLADICEYRKGKIDVAILNEKTYISTENMIPNKGGVTSASSLPAVAQTQAFSAGDVLVSNIRPYFKKIWFAEYDVIWRYSLFWNYRVYLLISLAWY